VADEVDEATGMPAMPPGMGGMGGMKSVIRQDQAGGKSAALNELGIQLDMPDDSKANEWEVSMPSRAFGDNPLAADLKVTTLLYYYSILYLSYDSAYLFLYYSTALRLLQKHPAQAVIMRIDICSSRA
ncbi:hypothetical protein B484DRAFT_436941, partial [Ochromonadaceae sp. CCMP2298]